MDDGDGHGPHDRPWVVVNYAMSADGKLALADRTQVEISGEEDMLRVHRLRASCDAILVGARTVLSDDPKLHVSPHRVPDPPGLLKVVLDSSGTTPGNARFLESPGRALVATTPASAALLTERLAGRAEVVTFGPGPWVDLRQLMTHLRRQGVKRLMVEGGGETIWSVLNGELADELSVYVGPMVLGGRDAPMPADGEGVRGLEGRIRLEVMSAERLGDGVWIHYRVTGRH